MLHYVLCRIRLSKQRWRQRRKMESIATGKGNAGTWTTDVLTRQDKKPRRPWRKNIEKPDRQRDTTGMTGITKGTNINQGTELETWII